MVVVQREGGHIENTAVQTVSGTDTKFLVMLEKKVLEKAHIIQNTYVNNKSYAAVTTFHQVIKEKSTMAVASMHLM